MNEDLIKLFLNSNAECLCSSKLSNQKLDSLPCFDDISSTDKNPNLHSIDIDFNVFNLPIATNFDYFIIYTQKTISKVS